MAIQNPPAAGTEPLPATETALPITEIIIPAEPDETTGGSPKIDVQNGWIESLTEAGDVYFYHPSGYTTWENPMVTKMEWMECYDEYQNLIYVNSKSGELRNNNI